MPVWARTLTPDEALLRARNEAPAKAVGAARTRLVKTGYTPLQRPAYYIFDNADNGGYMILAADDVAMPVLGYSESGTINPDDMPENLSGWLENYAAEIAWAAERETSANSIHDGITKNNASRPRDSWEPIAPLCATKWNQGKPYNLLTPDNLPGESQTVGRRMRGHSHGSANEVPQPSRQRHRVNLICMEEIR